MELYKTMNIKFEFVTYKFNTLMQMNM